jgi:hypothetical protein
MGRNILKLLDVSLKQFKRAIISFDADYWNNTAAFALRRARLWQTKVAKRRAITFEKIEIKV